MDSRRTFLHDVMHCFSPQDKWMLTGWQAQVRSWETLRLKWTWLPLRNSQVSEGESYVTRHNEVNTQQPQRAKHMETQPQNLLFLWPRDTLTVRQLLTAQEFAEKGNLNTLNEHIAVQTSTLNSLWKTAATTGGRWESRHQNQRKARTLPRVDVEGFLKMMACEPNLKEEGTCAKGRALRDKLLIDWRSFFLSRVSQPNCQLPKSRDTGC